MHLEDYSACVCLWVYLGLYQPAEVFAPAALVVSRWCGLFPPSADVELEPPAGAPLTDLREKKRQKDGYRGKGDVEK